MNELMNELCRSCHLCLTSATCARSLSLCVRAGLHLPAGRLVSSKLAHVRSLHMLGHAAAPIMMNAVCTLRAGLASSGSALPHGQVILSLSCKCPSLHRWMLGAFGGLPRQSRIKPGWHTVCHSLFNTCAVPHTTPVL